MTSSPPKLSLAPSAYQDLLKAERGLTAQLDNFDKLETCGVDCMALRQLVQEKLAQIQAIKANFAPPATAQY